MPRTRKLDGRHAGTTRPSARELLSTFNLRTGLLAVVPLGGCAGLLVRHQGPLDILYAGLCAIVTLAVVALAFLF